MCGICGVYDTQFNNRIENWDIVEMTKSLIHRGPDEINYCVGKNIGFGFTRLSIIDLETGNQPLFSEDKSIILVCNGEIFNYIELRDVLFKKGHYRILNYLKKKM